MSISQQEKEEIQIIVNEEFRDICKETFEYIQRNGNKELQDTAFSLFQNYVFPSIALRVKKIKQEKS